MPPSTFTGTYTLAQRLCCGLLSVNCSTGGRYESDLTLCVDTCIIARSQLNPVAIKWVGRSGEGVWDCAG